MIRIENGVHWTDGSLTETHKRILIRYGQWAMFFEAHFHVFMRH